MATPPTRATGTDGIATPARAMVAVGLPLLVGAMLAGRRAPPLVASSLHALSGTARETTVADLPVWADEMRRMLPSQPDPILSPLAVLGADYPTLLLVAAASLVGSACFLLILARLARIGPETAGFTHALACALHLKILVLLVHWGGDRLTGLAPAETLATLGGPRVALASAGALATLMVTRSAFGTGFGKAFMILAGALVLPLLFPFLLSVTGYCILTPLVVDPAPAAPVAALTAVVAGH